MANNVTTCIPCQKNHWIEIQLVDEHAEPITGNISGTLVTNDNQSHDVKLSQGYLLLTEIPAGPVTLKLITDPWLESVYPHKPRKTDENNPVPAYTQSKMGYQSSSREYKNITVGDLWSAMPESAIPKRHQPGATGQKLVLVADHSYVLEVRAFKFLTVRLGMFFDGTGNNTYNAELAKEKTSIWAERCEKPEQENTLAAWCSANPNAGSAANEITNVQKMYDLYQPLDEPKDDIVIVRQYVEGIGTTNDGTSSTVTDDASYGLATGAGETGVDGKVKKGCEAVVKSINKPLKDADYDGVGCFLFDVFGFSRGAAAARHFVNVVTQGEQGYLGKAIRQQGIMLSAPFDWKNPQQCQFTFVGVFDTVAAIVDPRYGDLTPANSRNPGIHLALPVEQTLRAVHITAADEFRDYFSLNKLNAAPHFLEVTVPGAHSDVGGGYYSRYYLNEKNTQAMNQALLENITVSAYSSSLFMVDEASVKRTQAWRKAEADKARLIRENWATESQINIEYKIKQNNAKNSGQTSVYIKVKMKRIVEGELSRINLRLMYGLAKHAKVPVQGFDPGAPNYKVPGEIAEVADDILNKAEIGQISPHLMALHSYLRSRFVHYSSSLDLIALVHPNAPAENNQRHIYPCEESSS